MRKRFKLPAVGAFNAKRGSILAVRPMGHCANANVDTVVYVRLTQWRQANNRTLKEARGLIQKRILLAQKFKGVWWVAENPNLEGLIADY